MMNTRLQDTLPSDTENPNPHPRGKEHCKVITLRRGKQTDETIKKFNATTSEKDEVTSHDTIVTEEGVVHPKTSISKPTTLMKNVQHDEMSKQSEVSVWTCKQQPIPFP
ncbi:hypothetical protein V6N12_062668 [Hibiscus sabdariffa]|uniref:Uncharacterized protein n=1 Tax=Hibiscus sabdariffa TaxID=183260 RepID=A0ABR2F9J0_9ROSI